MAGMTKYRVNQTFRGANNNKDSSQCCEVPIFPDSLQMCHGTATKEVDTEPLFNQISHPGSKIFQSHDLGWKIRLNVLTDS